MSESISYGQHPNKYKENILKYIQDKRRNIMLGPVILEALTVEKKKTGQCAHR